MSFGGKERKETDRDEGERPMGHQKLSPMPRFNEPIGKNGPCFALRLERGAQDDGKNGDQRRGGGYCINEQREVGPRGVGVKAFKTRKNRTR